MKANKPQNETNTTGKLRIPSGIEPYQPKKYYASSNCACGQLFQRVSGIIDPRPDQMYELNLGELKADFQSCFSKRQR